MNCRARLLGRALFFQMALIGTGKAADDEVGGEQLTGRVVLQLDGEPVRDVRVQFTDRAGNLYETTSAPDGFFSLILSADTAIDADRSLPGHFALGPAYPNPFNPSTTIPFDLPQLGTVRLIVYNALGQAVRNLLHGELAAGTWRVVWNGLDDRGIPVAAGVYIYHLQTDRFSASGKVAVLDGSSGRRLAAPPLRGSKVTAPHTKQLYDVIISGAAIDTLKDFQVDPLADDFNPVFEVVPERIDHPDPSGVVTVMTGIPGSAFRMGSEQFQDESPVHEVWVDPFYLSLREATVAQYRACVEAGNCSEPARGEACNWGVKDRDDHPVNCISWTDAVRYCQWSGLRLPTEAEWEKAARGVAGRQYPWGDQPPGGAGGCDRAIMMRAGLGLGCGYDGTGPVGTRENGASVYGVDDMAGNVWEWVADSYERDYYQRSPEANPVNVAETGFKVVRGNSWYYLEPNPDMRAANRYRFRPQRWYPLVGVRCARSTQGSEFDLTFETEPQLRAIGYSDWMRRNQAAMAAEGDTIPASDVEHLVGEMVFIEEGEFIRGREHGESDERPQRTVYVDAYYIGRFEVTVNEYRECVEEDQCTPAHSGPGPYRLAFEDHYTNYGKPGRDFHAVNAVSWYQADQYCRWAGKRLPTEAEWEKAARGSDGRTYPWGEEDPTCERIVMDDSGDGCGQEMPWRVGSKPQGASPYGVMDMSGNVWEWVQDWYDRDYYDWGPTENPLNTEERHGNKVLRGGSFADQHGRIHTTTNRLGYDPNQRWDYTVGFRCARDGDS